MRKPLIALGVVAAILVATAFNPALSQTQSTHVLFFALV